MFARLRCIAVAYKHHSFCFSSLLSCERREPRKIIMVARCTFKSDDLVVKSPNDRRLYRVIELENGLCALLVHDPEIYPDIDSKTLGQHDEAEEEEEDDDNEEDSEGEDDEEDSEGEDDDDDDEEEEEEDEECNEVKVEGKGKSQTKKAAAAMCVAMGSFSDPFEAQGLAHFLEHMLFMGSTEFPDENEYDSYLSKHGGSSNAYTETEHTCYHFEVKPEFLKGALRRFSQFFISPLVKIEAMEREVLRGIDLREHILRLYRDYYHGGLMKLVVIGGESLDVLEGWVTELLANVRKGSLAKPTFEMQGPIWKTGKLYRLEAVKDVHILDLTWTLPCLRQDYLKKSEDYLAHLLGHEGRGSLHSFLKAKGWATSLSAGVGDEGMHRSSIAYIFGMSIHLTDSGLEKIFDMIGFVYQYLKLLRQVSPQEWIFKELQDIANMEFRFAEEQPQDDYAAELAEHLLVYPAEHVIYGEYLYKVWDEEMIKHLLGVLTPENMRIDVVSKSFTKEQDMRCIIDEPLMKFWYKLDNTFKLPRANTYFRINLKGAYSNVTSCLLTELFIQLLKDELNEIIYQASIAKLETSVSFIGDMLELKVYGFNDKVPVLLSKVLVIAKSFLPTNDRFKVIKENIERSLKNANMKPLSHSSYLRLQVLCKSFYDVEEKLCVLRNLSLADLKAFILELRSQLFIEGLCHGNLLEGEAINLSNIFKSNLSLQPLPVHMRHRESVLSLPLGSNLARDVNVKNKSETNSVVELYFQIEPEIGLNSIKLKALVDLFDEIVDEPLFNQLRTKEQLGYVVECSPRVTYRVYGFCFCVQSSKYSPVYLQDRIENFISGLEELLAVLDEASFENYKNGLMAKLLEKDPSLQYETNRLWNQIVDKRYTFDFSEQEAEELKTINKNDVVNWYKTYLQQSSSKCRRLAVRVWGCNTSLKEFETTRDSEQVIKDLSTFKMSSEYYPSFC
eukprot:XP_015574163.1 nardilysin-like [Ricinus communis]